MKRTIMHIDYKLPSFVLLCSGICFGELIGIIIAILDRDLLGIVTGACLGIFLGLAGTTFSFITIWIFNTFADNMGGWQIKLEETPPQDISHEKGSFPQ